MRLPTVNYDPNTGGLRVDLGDLEYAHDDLEGFAESFQHRVQMHVNVLTKRYDREYMGNIDYTTGRPLYDTIKSNVESYTRALIEDALHRGTLSYPRIL